MLPGLEKRSCLARPFFVPEGDCRAPYKPWLAARFYDQGYMQGYSLMDAGSFPIME